MKKFKINIIRILSSIILLISCSDQGCGGVLNITDTIVNNTDYVMEATIWGNYHLSSIKGKDILSISKKSEVSRDFEFQKLVMTLSDSIRVTFNNKKKLLFKNDEIRLKRTETNNDSCRDYYIYTFTNEDYDNAEDCNGDCE